MNPWSRWKQRAESRDKKTEQFWFSRSFISQMTEIEGEMERILRDEGRLERIRNDRDYVGEPQVIQRVFEIVKRDPKNAALLREVERAEKETVAFLSGEPDAPTAEEMRNYWGKYLQAYLAELEQKEAKTPEKSSCKNIQYVVDSLDMFQFKRDYIRREGDKWICDGTYTEGNTAEEISVCFKVYSTADVFSLMSFRWGGWNECPAAMEMRDKAREWENKYSAELKKISHDTLYFQCGRRLKAAEVEELLADIRETAPNSMDIDDFHVIRERLAEEGRFVLWWD